MASVSAVIQELTLTWEVEKPIKKYGELVYSSEFTFAGVRCRFGLDSSKASPSYWLYLCAGGLLLRETCDATVCLVDGDRTILHHTSTARGAAPCIWIENVSIIVRHIPDFHSRSHVCFRIVLRFPSPPSSSSSDAGTNAGTNKSHRSDKSIQTPPYLDTRFCSLCRDLDKLLNDDGSTGDVRLECGDRTSKAHRSVLQARSGVFSLLLNSNMKEGRTGLVEIRDMDWDTLQQFLGYLYTGGLPDLTVDGAKRLFQAGDKYAVDDLKEDCSEFLRERLTRDNALDLLILADRHSDPDLRECSIVYILDERIPFEEDASHWTQFCKDHPKLASEVIKRFCRLFRPK